jgi:hypothetical protein
MARLPAAVARANPWKEALSNAPGHALLVSLCFLFSGLLWIFLFDVTGFSERSELSGVAYVIDLFSIIVVYPIAGVIGLGCFRFFPDRMNGRRSWKALVTGLSASLLVWSGLGLWLVRSCDDVQASMPLRSGAVEVLILCTPFAMTLTIAHALALLLPAGAPKRLPPGRPPVPVLPRRQTQ